jgi:hypothetical protein
MVVCPVRLLLLLVAAAWAEVTLDSSLRQSVTDVANSIVEELEIFAQTVDVTAAYLAQHTSTPPLFNSSIQQQILWTTYQLFPSKNVPALWATWDTGVHTGYIRTGGVRPSDCKDGTCFANVFYTYRPADSEGTSCPAVPADVCQQFRDTNADNAGLRCDGKSVGCRQYYTVQRVHGSQGLGLPTGANGLAGIRYRTRTYDGRTRPFYTDATAAAERNNGLSAGHWGNFAISSSDAFFLMFYR